MCPVCDRMLLGLEAQERRKLDESGILGRTLPCSSTCVGPSADGQTPAVTSSAGVVVPKIARRLITFWVGGLGVGFLRCDLNSP